MGQTECLYIGNISDILDQDQCPSKEIYKANLIVCS